MLNFYDRQGDHDDVERDDTRFFKRHINILKCMEALHDMIGSR